MNRGGRIAVVISLLWFVSCGGGGGGSVTVPPVQPPPGQPSAYVVLAWSELGMHCIDGKDYSVFGVLPPYNTLHAQVIKKAEPPQVIASGMTVTYEAIADTNGSINTTSAGKTNFWSNVQALFLAGPAPDTGLTGNKVQSTTPQPMSYNATLGVWEAVGIPTVPYDDAWLRIVKRCEKTVVADDHPEVLHYPVRNNWRFAVAASIVIA